MISGNQGDQPASFCLVCSPSIPSKAAAVRQVSKCCACVYFCSNRSHFRGLQTVICAFNSSHTSSIFAGTSQSSFSFTGPSQRDGFADLQQGSGPRYAMCVRDLRILSLVLPYSWGVSFHDPNTYTTITHKATACYELYELWPRTYSLIVITSYHPSWQQKLCPRAQADSSPPC